MKLRMKFCVWIWKATLVPSELLFLGHPQICARLPVLYSVVGRGRPGPAFRPHDHRVTGSVAGWGTVSYTVVNPGALRSD